MKSLNECLAWVAAVEACTKGLPEGVTIRPRDSFNKDSYTLRDVDPAAITALSTMFRDSSNNQRLEGSEDGYYYYLLVTLPTMEGKGLVSILKLKNSRKTFCFFYRKRTAHPVPRIATYID